MVKTPGGYFTNTEIEQVFKDIVEGEIITINKKKYQPEPMMLKVRFLILTYCSGLFFLP